MSIFQKSVFLSALAGMLLPIAFIIAIALALTGCQTAGLVTGSAVEKVREFNDSKIKAAKFVICEESSIGAVRRAFGKDPASYNAFCTDASVEKLIK